VTRLPRVALFTETFLPKVDGIVSIMQIQLDHMRSCGMDVAIFAAGDRVSSYAGYPVYTMRGVPALMYPDLELAVPSSQTIAQLREFNPDVIHVLNPVMSGLVGMFLARQQRIPLLVSFHTHLMEMARFYGYEIFNGVLWWLHRLVYNRADRVLATSERIVEELEAQGIQEVRLWRRGVDVERFSPTKASGAMRSRLTGGHVERTLLLSAGRLAPEKQVEQIVPVLEHLRDRPVHLAIVGDGPHREYLESAFAKLPVTFTGYLHGDELASAFASADLFLFPSSSIETFGLVAAEALASGTPVIASDVGGMREIISHGDNGYIFPENDITAFADYVQSLVNDPVKRVEFGVAAMDSMQSRTWESIMDDLVSVYVEMASARAYQVARGA
jgi:glycosyltransferase involved in cell wall biosynthesis